MGSYIPNTDAQRREMLFAVGVQSTRDLFASVPRDMLVEIDQPGAGKLKITGNPMKLSDTPPDPKHAAPLLGQDTKSVLKDDFGFSEEQISKWESEKIF